MFKDVYTPISIFGRNVNIRHIQLKKRKRGKPIILLPGVGGFADSYTWNMEGLYNAGYWPIAVDNIGFGKSGKPKAFSYSINAFSLAIVKWIKVTKLRNVVLVGNSFGGGVSIGVYGMIPAKIAGIVLVSSAGFGCELSFNYRLSSIPGLTSVFVWFVVNKRFPINNGKKSWKSIIFDYNKLPDKFITLSDRYKIDHGIRAAYTYVLRHFISLAGQSQFLNKLILKVTDEIRDNKLPTLIIWGNNDQVIPKEHAYVASHHTNGKLVLFENCGHMPYIEHIEKFNKNVIDFVKSI